ncbi:hypothetical protein [Dulcicalothrix desertica]|uniref:hypothetical protein n=1 Tax=Dulcicalothrix desertica TaxID=32056 RepID=UPI000F8D92BC|nr:hypothetical protein [Dulcicalothrix desertica]TWH40775.1 hypothetical protein CAL7102_10130 [Dulcicalothrix desertica PCC 7102]
MPFGLFITNWTISNQMDLRDEYLAQWTIYEPKSRLLEAWALAKPLCALPDCCNVSIYCCLFRAKSETRVR